MEYKFCTDDNFEDYSSGRVLYGNHGIPNFPVRLGNEIYRRCLSYSEKETDLVLFDPCCGGGYLLTVLGFCNSNSLREVIGCDIDETMVTYAIKNTSLLTQEGLLQRKQEIYNLYETYGKASHKEAIKSAERLSCQLCEKMKTKVFCGDSTKPIMLDEAPDIILTDIPYGNLVDWQGDADNQLEQMLEQLARISHNSTVLAVIMDKKCRVSTNHWLRIEKQNVGKRKFEIYKIK
jgi:tRNA G10  N-methylase Trm11